MKKKFSVPSSTQNLIEMEKKLLKRWYSKGIVKKYLEKNKDSKKYWSFLDGPITANNPMGVHHAWGRTYKDLWQKFFNLLGYKQRFQNGFDCQGLWVEVEIEKQLGIKNKKEIEELVPGDKKASIAKFIKMCKERVRKYAGIQTEQSKRLGYFMDWDHSYFTMSDENNYMIWQFLKTCHRHGWLYKGKDSVPWCPRCQTAISQHEILTEDYKEIVHDSVFMKFPLKERENEYLLVWTTTPWTIPANVAVAVDKDLSYLLVENEGEHLWIEEHSMERVFGGKKRVIKKVKGKELEGLYYETAFDSLPVVKEFREKTDNFHKVVLTDPLILPISTEEGTGLVHTATGAGTEDFKLGKKLGFPVLEIIDDEANYLEGLGFLSHRNAKKNPRIILDFLKERKRFLLKIEKYKHRYPVCWRCKTELVWKVTDEWYIAMDKPSKIDKKNKKTLRQRMIEVAKKIKWMPEFGLDRELDWLSNMQDWLISKKNRYWGLSLPIYECEKCGRFDVVGSKEELKERAVEGWEKFSSHSPHKPYIDEVKIRCPYCGGVMKRVSDVGNPWLDAGIVPFSTISENNQGEPLYKLDKKKWRKWFPADFITESFPGQFKNWFYSLIAMSTVLENTNPYKRVLGFGTLLGEDGRPMHKSWGNAIEFNEGADKIGVDVIRWMFARQNPAENMLFGYKKAAEVRRQFYLILWNSYRFFVSYVNLEKFNTKLGDYTKVPETTNILDEWLLSYFIKVIGEVKKYLKDFDARNAALLLEKFITDLSTWYIRESRSRLWLNSEDKRDKESFYKTLYYVFVNLSIILSPFLPFITDEIYLNLGGKKDSVHLEMWPEIKLKPNEDLLKDMDLVMKIVEAGRRERKELGIKIRQPLQKASIYLKKGERFRNRELIDSLVEIVKKELNVKEISLTEKQLKEFRVGFNTKLTPELKKEGELRELLRKIQFKRKRLGVRPDERVKLIIDRKFKNFENLIKKKILVKEIKFNNEGKIEVTK